MLVWRELGRKCERNEVALTFRGVTGVFEEIKGGQCRNSQKDKVPRIFRKAVGDSAQLISSLKHRDRRFQGLFPNRGLFVDPPGRPFTPLHTLPLRLTGNEYTAITTKQLR